MQDDADTAFINGAETNAPAPVTETPAAPEAPAAEAPAEEPKGEPAAEPETAAAEGEEGKEPAEEPAKTDDEGDGKPRTPWFQKRIDTLTREKHDAARERDAVRAQLEAFLRSQSQPAPEGEERAPAPAQQPSQAPEQMTAVQIRAAAEQLRATERFNETCNDIYDKGSKAFPKDFTAAVGTLNTALGGITPELIDAATEAGDAHKVLYHLGKNPELAIELAGMTPTRMAVRMAKIASDLNKPAAPKPVSKAPAPVAPIGGGSSGAETDPEKMSIDQWMKWDADRQEKRRQRA
jgi:hypothetical protein